MTEKKMPTENGDLRPLLILTEMIEQYGLDREGAVIGGKDRPALVYALVGEHTATGAWLPKWKLVGIGTENHKDGKPKELVAIMEGYSAIFDLIVEAPTDGAALYPLALALVAHGEAQVGIGNAETGEIVDPENIPDEIVPQLIDRLGENYRERLRAGHVDARSVAVITPEGVATEMTMKFADSDIPERDFAEQWLGDMDNADEPQGPAINALTKAFGMLVMSRGAIDAGHPPTMNGLMSYCREMIEEGAPGATAMFAFLLRLTASGVESGTVKFSTNDDDEPGSVGDIFG